MVSMFTRTARAFTTLVAMFILSGCLTDNNYVLRSWRIELEKRGIDPQEGAIRSPAAAAAWSLLPAGGSIYNGESAGMTVASLFTWFFFLGPLWHPFVEYKEAKIYNMIDTAMRHGVDRETRGGRR